MIKTAFTLFYYSLFVVNEAKFNDNGNNSANFATVTRSRYFVDETLLIAELFQNGNSANNFYAAAVRAPPKFGKSTVLDMIKRFAGITVDRFGLPITSPNNTENYRLFCGDINNNNSNDKNNHGKPLKICRDREFVRDHFGRYPIVHIDCSPLKNLTDVESMSRTLRTVAARTFAEHSYLRHYSKLFPLNDLIYQFRDHCSRTAVHELEDEDIRNAFTWLCELLHKHFDRKVIVLIDDYDILYKGLLVNREPVHYYRVDEILDYVNWLWLKNNSADAEHVEFVFMTGTFRRLTPMGGALAQAVVDYPFLGDHKFAAYYGITVSEVASLLRLDNDKNIMERLTDFYGGYSVRNRTELFSFPSIIEYLRRNNTVGDYWPENEYTKAIERICQMENVKKIIAERLLSRNGNVTVKNSPLLTRKDAAKICRTGRKTTDLKEQEDENDRLIELYLLLMADLGLLVPIDVYSKNSTNSNNDVDHEIEEWVTLKIPNREIGIELERMSKKVNGKRIVGE